MLGCFILVIIPQSGQPTPSSTIRQPRRWILRCILSDVFSAPFATDTETFGYLQVQHLFAHSFYRLSIGNSDSGPHVDHAHQFNVVVYGDCDGGAGSGIRTRVSSLEGWRINPYTMPAKNGGTLI